MALMDPRQVGALLLVVGLLVVAHPLYLWPHFGQTPYTVEVAPAAGDDLAEDATVLAYEELPADAQRAFDAALENGRVELFSEADAAAIEGLGGDGETYVRKDGSVYRVSLYHADGAWLFVGPIRTLLSILGAALAVTGGLAAVDRSARPLTPARALWLPAGAVVAVVATAGYDAGGAVEAWNLQWALVVVLATLPVVPGSAVARERRTWAAGFLSALVVVALGVAALTPLFPVWIPVVGLLAGAPAAVVGYTLTTGGERRGTPGESGPDGNSRG